MSAAGAYETVIGLEVHAHLLTRSKMFCGCSTAFGAEPNSQTCPVCQGMPGVLPVINRRAVELGIRTALALGCRVNQHNRFARKHYYYPDMPKNYQISQYEEPLAEHGMLEVEVGGATRTIGIQRLHLEEDVGKLIHEGTLETAPASNVDFNRAGVPLMEIVSKPDLRSPEEAGAYLRTLRGMVRFLQVCDGNMEEGSLRCDANVSIRPRGTAELGTKVEIKNLNSFRHVQHALEYEVTRQTRALETGEALVQETRLWNADTGRTVSMRSKEYAHDYRYFPEPDLPPLSVEERWVEEIRRGSPKLAEFYQKTLVEQYGISVHEARLATPSAAMAEYVLTTVSGSPNPKAAMNWILNEVYHVVDPEDEEAVRTFSIPAANLIGLLRLTADGTISGKIAKDVFDKMRTGEDAATIVRREGLTQVADAGELGTVVDQVLAQNPKVVDDWKKGKTAALGFLVGQVMKATSGKANPALVNTLLGEKLPRL
jgi:aspartyl-tRNA(Asn)/glutamyl-tRNA(Gln) amidotransferase subunit B